MSLSLFLLSKRARLTHAHLILFRFYSRRSSESLSGVQRLWIHALGISRPSDENRFNLVSSRERSFNFYRCTVFLSFFFFLLIRENIGHLDAKLLLFSPSSLLLASLPLIIFLPSSGAITFLHLLLVQHTSSREFSIPLTIMFTRVMMDNSHAGSLLRCLSSSFLRSFTLIDRYLSSYSPVSLLFWYR